MAALRGNIRGPTKPHVLTANRTVQFCTCYPLARRNAHQLRKSEQHGGAAHIKLAAGQDPDQRGDHRARRRIAGEGTRPLPEERHPESRPPSELRPSELLRAAREPAHFSGRVLDAGATMSTGRLQALRCLPLARARGHAFGVSGAEATFRPRAGRSTMPPGRPARRAGSAPARGPTRRAGARATAGTSGGSQARAQARRASSSTASRPR